VFGDVGRYDIVRRIRHDHASYASLIVEAPIKGLYNRNFSQINFKQNQINTHIYYIIILYI
jgi:hypothetical protein